MNRLYFYFVKGLDQEQRDKFDGELYSPLGGEVAIADIMNAPDVAE